MSLYINRIRYKGITPTMASSSGIVNNAVYDGLEFYDNDYQPTPPTPSINYVHYIYCTDTPADNLHKALVIPILTKDNMTLRLKGYYRSQYPAMTWGHEGTGDSNDYRIIHYDWQGSNQVLFDVKSSRNYFNSFFSNTKTNYAFDATYGNYYVKNNLTEQIQSWTAQSNVPQYYLGFNVGVIKVEEIQIKYGDEIVFYGKACLDDNDFPCIYDEVSGNYYYATYYSGNTWDGINMPNYVRTYNDGTINMGYDSSTPCTLSLSVNDSNMGSANGAGTYYAGDSVSISASSNTGYRFVGWYDGNTLVSSSSTYSFTIHNNVSYEARFEVTPQYTISLNVNDANMGSASGSGTYYDGTTVSIVASPNSGYRFVGWYDSNTLVSSSSTYSFVIHGNISYEARFEVSTGNYTPVSYIKKSSSVSNWYNLYFDTGISTDSSKNTLEIQAEFYITGSNGSVMIGHTGAQTAGSGSTDSADFRCFEYMDSTLYFDCGDGRTSFSQAINYTKDIIIQVDFNNRKYRIYNNNSWSSYTSFNNNPYNYNIFISLQTMKFKSMTILQNEQTVFNGVAAIDNNNVPCIYDSVTDSLIYAQGSASNYITYES